ncbi:MAG: hypothetical protein K6G52_02310 [Treponemataceae bacterium]|nr:hypothetical protein [Treponemataceae bacterium]
MKRFIKFLPFLLVAFLFTSCLDYVQAISYRNGSYQIYYKFTVSRAILELSGENPADILGEIDAETAEDFPSNAEYKNIKTDNEIGYEFRLTIDPRTTDELEKSFLPKISGNKCYIPFIVGEEGNAFAQSDYQDMESEDKELYTAFLESAKCRILVSKTIIPLVETAFFEGTGGQNYSIPVFDYGECFALEIPFDVLIEKETIRTDRIVVIKG